MTQSNNLYRFVKYNPANPPKFPHRHTIPVRVKERLDTVIFLHDNPYWMNEEDEYRTPLVADEIMALEYLESVQKSPVAFRTGVRHGFGGWQPWFTIGSQTFYLQHVADDKDDINDTEERAEWYEDSLKIALNNLSASLDAPRSEPLPIPSSIEEEARKYADTILPRSTERRDITQRETAREYIRDAFIAGSQLRPDKLSGITVGDLVETKHDVFSDEQYDPKEGAERLGKERYIVTRVEWWQQGNGFMIYGDNSDKRPKSEVWHHEADVILITSVKDRLRKALQRAIGIIESECDDEQLVSELREVLNTSGEEKQDELWNSLIVDVSDTELLETAKVDEPKGYNAWKEEVLYKLKRSYFISKK